MQSYADRCLQKQHGENSDGSTRNHRFRRVSGKSYCLNLDRGPCYEAKRIARPWTRLGDANCTGYMGDGWPCVHEEA